MKSSSDVKCKLQLITVTVFKVCTMLENGAVRHFHSEHLVPYAVQGSVWVGYDETQSFMIKVIVVL